MDVYRLIVDRDDFNRYLKERKVAFNFKLSRDYKNFKEYSEIVSQEFVNSKDIKNFINSIYVKKLKLDLGINLINTILNVYVSTLINVVINMFIANNINRFNLENTRYKTYISGEVYNIKIDSIIHLQLANIIYIIIKIIFKLRKVEKKNVRSKTSNRKFNDDSYDFA